MKEKSQRTVEASTKALKAAEETAQRQLAEAQQRTQQATNTAVSNVKPPWFTKFHWFITSDNYLVLGGRDAHQNEVLVKKYLRPGDAYLHADVHGAASCILRAKRVRVPGKKGQKATTKTLPLSDQALREAGNFTICRSSAWTSKMVTSAWWVESHQVSKTAPTGEYLKVGAFMIRGKKNFLPPTQLEMGLGVMFRLAAPEGQLDPATYARHKNERRDFALMEILQQQEEDDMDDMDDQDGDVGDIVVASKPRNTDTSDDRNEIGNANIDVEKEEEVVSSWESNAKGEPKESSAPDSEKDEAQQEQSATNPQPEPEPSPASSNNKNNNKKKGLSVKERKLIKKYGSLEEAERVLAEREKEEQEKEKEKLMLAELTGGDDEDDEDENEADQNSGSMKRGKRGKKKKLLKKYADQDEEDRELAMLALQGGEKIKKDKDKRLVEPTTEEQKQAAAETAALLVKDAGEIAENLPEDIRGVLAECVTVQNTDDAEAVVRWDKFDADVLDQLMSFEGPNEAKLAAAKRLRFLKSTSRVDNFSASLAGILRTIRKYGYENLETDPNAKTNEGPSRKTKEAKKAESAEWKKTLAEEGLVEDDAGGDEEDADIDDTAENNKLTGKPHPEDALLYALPVCAPYQTLSQYTYRIKLTPGNQKRGKAAKQCVDMFLKGDVVNNTGKKVATPASDIARDLIKKVADNDWIQTLCADVKISAAGASKVTKKQKANNKAKAKKKK
jgi:NFACT protein RNA binding domain/NFACT protein C-terminal domain